MRRTPRRWTAGALAPALALALVGAGIADAHQTAYNHGVAVTMHVSPDDEPVARQAATINVVRVKVPSRGRFSFRSCGCRLRVTDSSGAVILSRRAGKHTRITFPRPAAYQIVFSGSYRRGSKKRSFRTTFAIRADAS
jgi:hypothetical protein